MHSKSTLNFIGQIKPLTITTGWLTINVNHDAIDVS